MRSCRRSLSAVASLLALVVATPRAHATIRVETVHTGVAFPTALRFAPDGRLFVLERAGRVLVYATGQAPSYSVWATLPTLTNYNHGLLGIAFHPSFPDSPYVYLFHTNPSPLEDRVVRLTDSLGVGIHYCVMRGAIPASGHQHDGGRLCFLADGTLLVTYGDNNVPSAARDLNDARGKLLHLTSLGGVPAGQPFGVNDPAWVYGIRNVFGAAEDPVSHTIYFTMNGPTCDDTIHRLLAGADYGWGPADTTCGVVMPGAQTPLWRFGDVIAPTGCVVYRGSAYPGWDGDLMFGAYLDGTVRRAAFHSGSRTQVDSIATVATLTSAVLDVTQGPDGLLWACTTDAVHRLVWEGAAAVAPGDDAGAFDAWPDPARGAVTFTWRDGTRARLEILDVGGRRVRATRATGRYVWDGRDADGRECPAGVYLVRLTDARGTRTRRIVRLGR